MKKSQLNELILQSLAHERGGVKVYSMALTCAQNEDLKEEWQQYLEQTERHVTILEEVCSSMEIDSDEETPGTDVVEALGAALVNAMQESLASGNSEAAELVACECVVLAETKDHLDWQLIEACGLGATGDVGRALRNAAEEVESQEDEHLYHSKGWCRELWRKSLGLKAVLPPPEERQHAMSAIAAARAEKAAHPK